MNREGWERILVLLQEKLRDAGQDEIANLSNYEYPEGTRISIPNKKIQVIEMLNALQRDIAVRSSTTVEQSLVKLKELIGDGDSPTEAVVRLNRNEDSDDGREVIDESYEKLTGEKDAPDAIKVLDVLITEFKEISYQRDDE